MDLEIKRNAAMLPDDKSLVQYTIPVALLGDPVLRAVGELIRADTQDESRKKFWQAYDVIKKLGIFRAYENPTTIAVGQDSNGEFVVCISAVRGHREPSKNIQ